MASYPFQEIETKWQKYWKEEGTFRHVSPEISTDPKYYVLDMFPYPSGAGVNPILMDLSIYLRLNL